MEKKFKVKIRRQANPASGSNWETFDLTHGEVDVQQLLRSKARRKITGTAYETDRVRYAFFDEQRGALQARVDEQLAGYENHLVSYARDESRYVVYSGGDRTRGSYHLLDAASGELTHLFDLSPWLDEGRMAEMQPVTLESRDGLTLHGYLTLRPRVAFAISRLSALLRRCGRAVTRCSGMSWTTGSSSFVKRSRNCWNIATSAWRTGTPTPR